MTPEFTESLKKMARRRCWWENENGEVDDDFAIDDYAGGNIDDAYYGGVEDGNTKIAREVLSELGISWA